MRAQAKQQGGEGKEEAAARARFFQPMPACHRGENGGASGGDDGEGDGDGELTDTAVDRSEVEEEQH